VVEECKPRDSVRVKGLRYAIRQNDRCPGFRVTDSLSTFRGLDERIYNFKNHDLGFGCRGSGLGFISLEHQTLPD
jgi:hypothetical protein